VVEVTIDELLSVLGSPTRRRILEMLAEERHYPLQLSRELKVSQQAISKHLKILEEADLVRSMLEDTPGGPPHRCYIPTKRLSLFINMGPNLFQTDMFRLEEGLREDFPELEETLKAVEAAETPNEKVRVVAAAVDKLNNEIQELEVRHTRLARMKEALLRDAYGIIERSYDDYHQRRIARYVVETGVPSLEDLSEGLDMRMKVLEGMVNEIFPGLYAQLRKEEEEE